MGNRNLVKLGLALYLAVAISGCALFPIPPPPKTNGGIAESDPALAKPMRPGANKNAVDDPASFPWYDVRRYMDPRSQEVERHLGV
jgi:hypothetical protein